MNQMEQSLRIYIDVIKRRDDMNKTMSDISMRDIKYKNLAIKNIDSIGDATLRLKKDTSALQAMRQIDAGKIFPKEYEDRMRALGPEYEKYVNTYNGATISQLRTSVEAQKIDIASRKRTHDAINSQFNIEQNVAKQSVLNQKREIESLNAKSRLAMAQFRLTHHFKMEYLGLMFASMIASRALNNFWKTSFKAYNDAFIETSALEKQTNKLSAAWSSFQFRVVDALLESGVLQKMVDTAVGFLQKLGGLSDLEIKNLALNIAAVTGGVAATGIIAQTVLAGSSLGMALGMSPALAIASLIAVDAPLSLIIADLGNKEYEKAINDAVGVVGLVFALATKQFKFAGAFIAIDIADALVNFLVPGGLGKGIISDMLDAAKWGLLVGVMTKNPYLAAGAFVLTLGVRLELDYQIISKPLKQIYKGGKELFDSLFGKDSPFNPYSTVNNLQSMQFSAPNPTMTAMPQFSSDIDSLYQSSINLNDYYQMTFIPTTSTLNDTYSKELNPSINTQNEYQRLALNRYDNLNETVPVLTTNVNLEAEAHWNNAAAINAEAAAIERYNNARANRKNSNNLSTQQPTEAGG